MENRIENVISTLNYTFLITGMIASAILAIKDSIIILFLYLVVLSLYALRNHILLNEKEKQTANEPMTQSVFVQLIITYGLELSIALILQRYDHYLITFVIFATIIEDLTFMTRRKLATMAACTIYLISCGILYLKLNDSSSSMILYMLITLLVYSIVFIIFLLVHDLLEQNEIIRHSLKDLTVRNIEMDNLNHSLKEAYSRVEIITTLRERNKIAAEIHDTVGHTLTTVLVELEAAKRLMGRDPDKAKEKLNLAQGQVRKGLNDIRGSVRILEKGEDILDFYNSLDALIQDTEKHSEVVVHKDMDRSITIPEELRNIIFSALMEGMSNGIRHGRCSEFFFCLKQVDENLRFLLRDNGAGSAVISPGFGLRAMKVRVEDFGGELRADSSTGEGFELELTLPLGF